MKDPDAAWDEATVTTFGYKNYGVRSEQYRYIVYEDGSEELYDHRVDPDEWTNLALDPAHDATKARFAVFLPKAPHPGLRVQDWFDKHQK